MQLKLTYHPTQKRPIAAAFLNGNTAKQWLTEINQWGIAMAEIEAYIMPQSKQSVEATGLFILFKYPQTAANLNLLQPYYCLEKRLFLPKDTMVEPAVLDSEWADLLLYPVQVYHPTIGLVGFSAADKIELTALIELPSALETYWDFANKGLDKNPPLRRIGMPEPLLDNLLNELAKGMDLKPLKDIPEDSNNQNKSNDFLNKLGQSALGGMAGMANGLGKMFGNAGTNGSGGGGGMLDGFKQWAAQQMSELERRRNTEINRLMDLFDKNMDEALKYALPLSDAYQNRGTATPGSRLGQRNTNFNLGGIGGGRAADHWQLDWQRREELRKKYLAAAQEQIRLGKFRKAAYIYGQLLGDLHSAANVLKQGKHYREAALLYRDHLKNKVAAAECFELGGHWTEALTLYEQLENYEKMGDIYTTLEQPDLAKEAYEEVIDRYLKKSDYVNSGKIILEKLGDTVRAESHYLSGWKVDSKAEICLKNYFKLMQGESKKIADKITSVYEQHTPYRLQLNLLTVLKEVKNRENNETISQVSQDIAYAVVSHKASLGDVNKLYWLNGFVDDDSLLEKDCQRYVVKNQTKPQQRPISDKGFIYIRTDELPANIKSIQAFDFKNVIIGFGYSKTQAIFYRLNWKMKIEQYQVDLPLSHQLKMDFFHEPDSSNYIFCSSTNSHFFQLDLKKSTDFPESTKILNLRHKLPNALAFAIEDNDTFTILRNQTIHGEEQVLQTYSRNFNIVKTIRASHHKKHLSRAFSLVQSKKCIKMFCRKKFYFFGFNKELIQIDEHGQWKYFQMNHTITKVIASPSYNFPLIVVVTDVGCQLLFMNQKGLKKIGSFFCYKHNITEISFIGANKIAIAAGQEIAIYNIRGNIKTPEFAKRLHLPDNVVGILTPPVRQQVAFLTRNGQLIYYQYN